LLLYFSTDDVTFAMNGGMDQPACGLPYGDLSISETQLGNDSRPKGKK
jgi:hypothetical protein